MENPGDALGLKYRLAFLTFLLLAGQLVAQPVHAYNCGGRVWQAITVVPANPAALAVTTYSVTTRVPALAGRDLTASSEVTISGNSTVESGETCDDGNRVTNPPSDTCPADCSIVTCAPAATDHVVAVSFSSPVGLTSIRVVLEYPDGAVQIPGTGADTAVSAAVTNRPSGFLTDVYDFDFAVQVTAAGTRALSGTQLCQVHFDDCADSMAPPISAFACRVVEANNTAFQPVSGVTCSVAFVP